MGAFTATIQDSNGVMTRRCRVCDEVKVLGGEHFHRNKSNKCGFHYDCKVCIRRSKLVRPPVYGPFYEKQCTKCRETLHLDSGAFTPHDKGAFGFKPRCKACIAQAARDERAANPEKILARERKNYGRRNAYQRGRWALDLEHRARGLAANKEWHRQNAEGKRASNQQWRRDNPDKVRKQLRDQYERDKNTPLKILRRVLSGRIGDSLRNRGLGKGGVSISDLLEFTVEELAVHLERQFAKGMTWDNRGTLWEIDHILPLASFEMREPGDAAFRAAWALTNLRPLLKNENRAKGAKRTLLL